MACDKTGQKVMVQYKQDARVTYFHQWIDFPPMHVFWDKDSRLTKWPDRALNASNLFCACKRTE